MDQTDSEPSNTLGRAALFGGSSASTQQRPTRLPLFKDYNPYKYFQDRLSTFEDWPKFLHPRPDALARAGFFYTKRGDKVKCMSCGVILCNWQPTDDAIQEHLRWSRYCPYINDLLCKGNEESKCNQCGRMKEWGYSCCL